MKYTYDELYELNGRLCPVFANHLGLPLLYAFHDMTDSPIYKSLVDERHNQLRYGTNVYEWQDKQKIDNNYQDLFQITVQEWWIKQENERNYLQQQLLTKILSEKICASKLGFNSFTNELIATPGWKGIIDMIFSEGSKNDQAQKRTTPLAVIEFGLRSADWWKKVDQNMSYVRRMCSVNNDNILLAFEQPFLFVVMTIETFDTYFESKIGVFLCFPKAVSGSNNKTFRFSLLWHSKATDLDQASKDFGKLLRVTSDFSTWRKC